MLLVQPSLKFSAGRANGATASNDTPVTSARGTLAAGINNTPTSSGNMGLDSNGLRSIRQGKLRARLRRGWILPLDGPLFQKYRRPAGVTIQFSLGHSLTRSGCRTKPDTRASRFLHQNQSPADT